MKSKKSSKISWAVLKLSVICITHLTGILIGSLNY